MNRKIEFFFICFIYNLILSKCEKNPESDAKYCSTQACQREAEYLRDIIDPSVDPCDDFYEHVCGRYIKKTTIPDDKTSYDAITKLDQNLKQQLNQILSSPINEKDIEPFKLSKGYYKACMNKNLIEELGLKPMKDHLNALGGWPVIEGKNWQEGVWSWQKILVELETKGFQSSFIVAPAIEVDFKNSSRRVIYIDQMSLGLDREYFVKGFDDPIMQAYYNLQVDTAVIYGADRFDAELEMKDVLDFEIRLAEISIPKEERRNMTLLYNPMTIKEFQPLFPIHDWHQFFDQILGKDNNVTEDEVIIITNFLDIIDELNDLLRVTPNRVIINYIFWRMTKTVPTFLNDEIRNRYLEFKGSYSGQKSFLQRWEECVNECISELPIATSALYVQHFFDKSSRDVAMEVVATIQEEFENILKTTEWMDEETRKEALNKLKLMDRHIGYPNELIDSAKISEYYEGLTINENEYFEAYLNIKKFENNKVVKKFRKPIDKMDWEKYAYVAMVNANYRLLENSIQIPAGFLQGILFSADRPKYLNYGTLGYTVGHEISHGFDDVGRQFDAYGNIVDWWQESTKRAYLEKARCIIDQYSNFTDSLTGMNLNGINAQGENIADNGGVITAYNAYLRYVEKNGIELPLSGLNYTSKQLFWISYGSVWCSIERPETRKLMILSNPHSPEEFRVNGVVMNIPEFSNDFGCSIDSNMNAKHKCRVW